LEQNKIINILLKCLKWTLLGILIVAVLMIAIVPNVGYRYKNQDRDFVSVSQGVYIKLGGLGNVDVGEERQNALSKDNKGYGDPIEWDLPSMVYNNEGTQFGFRVRARYKDKEFALHRRFWAELDQKQNVGSTDYWAIGFSEGRRFFPIVTQDFDEIWNAPNEIWNEQMKSDRETLSGRTTIGEKSQRCFDSLFAGQDMQTVNQVERILGIPKGNYRAYYNATDFSIGNAYARTRPDDSGYDGYIFGLYIHTAKDKPVQELSFENDTVTVKFGTGEVQTKTVQIAE